MVDREKVIRGLEACAYDSRLMQCENCPYHTDKARCLTTLMRDALALLREQEARVLSENEVRERLGTFVFVEMFSPQSGRQLCLIYGRVYEDPLYPHLVTVQEDSGIAWNKRWVDYGSGCWEGIRSGWRCWTSRPTPEQMRDMPWEGDSDAE